MRTSITDEADYREICARAADDPEAFATFRIDPAIVRTFEHVSPDQGAQYLEAIRASGVDVNLAAREIGGPATHDYGFGPVSPTTLRYLKVLCDLAHLDLDGATVIEIGAGYGGQARLITEHWALNSYRIVDLPEPQRLAATYLGHFDIGCKLFFGAPTIGGHDLLISNYAYSELSREVQESYRPLVETAEHGYMTCNFTSAGYGIDSMSRDDLAALHPGAGWIREEPQTWPGNEILVW